MATHVGQPVKFFPINGADPEAGQIILVHGGPSDLVDLVAWSRKDRAYVEHKLIAFAPTANDGDPYWIPFDASAD